MTHHFILNPMVTASTTNTRNISLGFDLLLSAHSVMSRRTNPIDDELAMSLSKSRIWPNPLEIVVYYYQSDGLIFHIYSLNKDTHWITELLSALKLKEIVDYVRSFEAQFDAMISRVLRNNGQYYTKKECNHSDITHFGCNYGLMQINYQLMAS